MTSDLQGFGNLPSLPSDKYLLQVLADAGVEMTEEDLRLFKAEVRGRALQGPQPAVIAGEPATTFAIISAVLSLISVGLTIVASFFKPKPVTPAKLKANQLGDRSITSQRRYAPRAGFDAIQEPAAIGSVIPVVYALKEEFQGRMYGGIRVNMPLLWSNVQSFGGHQMLRAVFLLSEGRLGSIDETNFAIGNNAISGFDLVTGQGNQLGSRLTIYYRRNGGRIVSGDRVVGRAANRDDGNAQNEGALDVFSVRRGGTWFQDFSSAAKPSTQTTFGVYTLIGNNLAYRVNPSLRPTVNAQLVPKGDEGNAKVVCDIDQAAEAQRLKFQAIFSSRSGLVSGSVGQVGSQITYRLNRSSDAKTKFTTEIAPESWEVTTEVLSQDLIQRSGSLNLGIQATVTAAQVLQATTEMANWLNIRSTTYDATTKKVTVEVGFRENRATNYLNSYDATYASAPTDDGTYTIKYAIKVKNVSNPKEEMEDNLKITVKRKTVINKQTTGNNQSPTLVTDGSGLVTFWNPGSFQQVTENSKVTWKFSPDIATVTMKYLVGKPGKESATDVAAAVAGRQKIWDDALVVGDLYKVGSALCVCTARTPANALFESEADFFPPAGGQNIDVTFTTIRPGVASTVANADLQVAGNLPQPIRQTATSGPHVYRVALGSVATSRPCRVVEIGLRSTLGIRLAGICNFADSRTYDEINADACLSKEGETVKKGTTLKVDIYNSGTITSAEERYSFFKIGYREAGAGTDYIELPQCFGVRSITQQSVFNSIQLLMPANRQWEFRFEPLSGWEIRNGIASGALELLDAKMNSVRAISGAGVGIRFNGKSIQRNRSVFSIATLRRTQNYNPDDPDGTGDIGIGFTDESSYADSWGKLAEAFPYEEIQSSASGGPEHEITYVNEIVPNRDPVPLYDNLALIGLNIRSSVEFAQFSQFSSYVTAGVECRRLLQNRTIGSSHLFPDVLLDLLTNDRYGRGDAISNDLIDFPSFEASARWCQLRGYFFDSAIVEKENIRQWAADVAATHLLIFGESGGKFFLRPIFPFDPATDTATSFMTKPVPVRALFTAGNIKEDSFVVQYLEAEDRNPIQVSVKYREERINGDLTSPGIFPIEREILVRERGTEADIYQSAQIESVDMSDYATNPRHAIDAAKYIAKFRRLTTHAIKFDTTYEGITSGLQPGDYIKVAMDINVYDEFNNGVVTPDGALVSTQQLANGGYPILYWNGDSSNPVTGGTLTVTDNGQKASPAGIMFTVIRASSSVQVYQIESIENTEDGYLSIEAVHAPTDTSDVLRLALNFDLDGAWRIQE